MTDNQPSITNEESSPLHELLSRLLESEKVSNRRLFPVMGTLQDLNQTLEHQPALDFVNVTFRGVGQIGFANNPISGFLFVIAVFIQSPWVALMLLVGVVGATLTAYQLGLDRPSIRNGIFGFNGGLIGLALGTFGSWGNGSGNPLWLLAVVVCAGLSTVLMQRVGLWMAVKLKLPAMGVPFITLTLTFLAIALYLPQPFFQFGPPPPFPNITENLNGISFFFAVIFGISQVFFSSKLLSAILIFVGLILYSPMGSIFALLGSAIGLLTGMALGIDHNVLYFGLWGYNSTLTAIATGGIFYAPNLRSLGSSSGAALLTALICWIMNVIMTPIGLPILSIPFQLGAYICFLSTKRLLPSLVPVAPYAIASPEEHRFRYITAKEVISRFRKQLKEAIEGRHHRVLFTNASQELKGDIRYIFDGIDSNNSGSLSLNELSYHFQRAGNPLKQDELNLIFSSMDVDSSGEIDFEEFGELMLRHRYLMSRFEEFSTYFIPIDADKNGVLDIREMNVVLASVDESPFSEEEIAFLYQKTREKDFTWERFIEVLLVI
ncbi:urea transporter [Dapis sp. BLCC M126]|uniref:urea transporter n=1 Tax=Dapis sp. BLCC M126 TaxID=3400189 RepID=UPI003CF02C73